MWGRRGSESNISVMSVASGAEFSADESGKPALLRKKKKKVKGEKRQPGKPRPAAPRSLEDPPAADDGSASAEGAAAPQTHEDKNPAMI